MAAEYLLLALVSAVHSRVDLHPVGPLPINLVLGGAHIDPTSLADSLSLICPAVLHLPLLLDELNATLLVPQKDHAANALKPGFLQAPDGTVLLVDETRLQSGQLTALGRSNMAALETLLQTQSLSYDFGFHPIEFPTDIPVLVLSSAPSVFQDLLRCRIFWTPISKSDSSSSPGSSTSFSFGTFGSFDVFRHYLQTARQTEFRPQISEEFLAQVESSFVQLRKADPSIQAVDLQDILTIARLVALSEGRSSWLITDLERALAMERARRARRR